MKNITITVKRCKDCPFAHICPRDCYLQEMKNKCSSTNTFDYNFEDWIDPNCPLIGGKATVKVVPGKIKPDTLHPQQHSL